MVAPAVLAAVKYGKYLAPLVLPHVAKAADDKAKDTNTNSFTKIACSAIVGICSLTGFHSTANAADTVKKTEPTAVVAPAQAEARYGNLASYEELNANINSKADPEKFRQSVANEMAFSLYEGNEVLYPSSYTLDTLQKFVKDYPELRNSSDHMKAIDPLINKTASFQPSSSFSTKSEEPKNKVAP